MSSKKTHSLICRNLSPQSDRLESVVLSIAKVSVIVLLAACSPVKKLAVGRDVQDILRKSAVFSQHHTGFSLYDIEANSFIATHNANLLFTPASNTKLLTMYATMASFRDSIPALLYQKFEDELVVQPIGEPTFLLEAFEHQPVLNYLKQQDTVSIHFEEALAPYGAGWAWDDYPFGFQAQRSWWPIYGNRLTVSREDSAVDIAPNFFHDFTSFQTGDKVRVSREQNFNVFQIQLDDTTRFEKQVPFTYDETLFNALLSDTLSSQVFRLSSRELTSPDTLNGQHIDTLLAKMLKPSDNFLAEQLLILSAWKQGFIDVADYIDQLKNKELNSLGRIVWVDGSGLSRYNLISPNFQVRLLKKAHENYGWKRLTAILPTGGEGTLQELYLDADPFIYAKTGTLSNNHCLSGFLITKSGKKLIFSLMNNHYTAPTGKVKKAMESLLVQIRESY